MRGQKSWDFDWHETGRVDAEMWRAYYNHQFLRLFWMSMRLFKVQLRIGWFRAVCMAYCAAWAALDFRMHRHSKTNNDRVLRNLTKFYKLMSDRYITPFDFRRAAELDLAWWLIDRTSQKHRTEIEKGVAEAAAVIYSADATRLKEYAHYRVEAMFAPVDRGSRRRFDPEDWKSIEQLTTKSWHALWRVVQR